MDLVCTWIVVWNPAHSIHVDMQQTHFWRFCIESYSNIVSTIWFGDASHFDAHLLPVICHGGSLKFAVMWTIYWCSCLIAKIMDVHHWCWFAWQDHVNTLLWIVVWTTKGFSNYLFRPHRLLTQCQQKLHFLLWNTPSTDWTEKKSSKPRCLWDDSGVGAFANFVVWRMDCCWCWAIKIRPDGTDMSIFVVLFQWFSVWDNPNRTNINALVVVTKVILCLKWLNWCAYAGHFSRLSLLCGVSHLN